jgi:hypothetical protein
MAKGVNNEDDQPSPTNDVTLYCKQSTLKNEIKIILAGGRKSGLVSFWTLE